LGEPPITESGNDRGDKLGQTERKHQSDGWSLGEAESVGSGDEDEGLRDDSDLEVDDHVDLRVVGTLVSGDAELVLEEGGIVDDDEEDDAEWRQLRQVQRGYNDKRQSAVSNSRRQGQVKSVSDTVREDLGQIPRVRSHGRQDTVERQGHDGTVVENSDDKDHEWGEVEPPDEGHESKGNNDTLGKDIAR
jgi:hypothetical protein